MHPILEEICRIPRGETVRPDVLGRWQRVLREDVQPLLDERDQLLADASKKAAKVRA